jgi:hypothetical protein
LAWWLSWRTCSRSLDLFSFVISQLLLSSLLFYSVVLCFDLFFLPVVCLLFFFSSRSFCVTFSFFTFRLSRSIAFIFFCSSYHLFTALHLLDSNGCMASMHIQAATPHKHRRRCRYVRYEGLTVSCIYMRIKILYMSRLHAILHRSDTYLPPYSPSLPHFLKSISLFSSLPHPSHSPFRILLV